MPADFGGMPTLAVPSASICDAKGFPLSATDGQDADLRGILTPRTEFLFPFDNRSGLENIAASQTQLTHVSSSTPSFVTIENIPGSKWGRGAARFGDAAATVNRYFYFPIRPINLGTAQWTFRFWYNADSMPTTCWISAATGEEFYIEMLGVTGFYLGDGNINNFSSVATPEAATFGVNHHVEVSRSLAGTYYYFFNGVLKATTTQNLRTDIIASRIYIGARPSQTVYMRGRMNDVQFIPGVLLHTKSFAVPTSPARVI